MDRFIRMALEAAERGLAEGGIPIGSVLVRDGEVLGIGHNRRVQEKSPILHAEIDALRQAGRQPAQVYRESVLYTTLSPCPMCSGAVLLYGIPHVVIGENRTYLGEESLLRARGVRVDVLDSEECYELLQRFIRENPALWGEDIGR